MKRVFIFIFIIVNQLLFAFQKLEIEAKNFYSNEKKGFLEFNGDVKVRKLNDALDTQKVIVTIDKEKKPTQYETFGLSYFTIDMKDKIYKGSCLKIIYKPKDLKYILKENVVIKETNTTNTIMGDEIIIDKKIGEMKVNGKDENPVKFTFEVEEK